MKTKNIPSKKQSVESDIKRKFTAEIKPFYIHKKVVHEEDLRSLL